MDSQQELQKILYQAEIYKKQLEQVNEQVNIVDITIKGMESSIDAMESLNKTEIGTEILVPLGSNSFARAKLSDNQEVIVGIGTDVSVEKKIPDAIKFFDKHIEDLNGALAEMQKKSAEIEKQLTQLNSIGEQLINESRKKEQI